MYTQCPKCRTIFAIDEEALQASLGIVHCGHCAERFDALLTLSDRLPADPAAPLPERSAEDLAPTLTHSIPTAGAMATGRHADAPAQISTHSSSDAAATRAPGSIAGHLDEAWMASLSGARTQALIADAAGIPAGALQGDSAWQVVELPLQSDDIELDVIPLVPAAGTESANDAIGVESTPFIEAVESEPFTGPWTVDIPGAEHAEVLPSPAQAAANLQAAEAAPDDTPAMDDTLPVEPDELPALTDTDIAADAAPEMEAAEVEHVRADPAEPVYVPPRHRRIRRSEWLWALGCLVLALGLAAQVAWANRVSLILDPATQNLALRACTRIACHLPPIRDTTQLELLSRDIRPDPKVAHALTITATFRNNAPFRQPWPVVAVRLTDLDNNPVAMRRFHPAEYLPDPRRRAAGIAPGATAAVAFEVADPGQRAVSFNFGFE